MRSRTLALLLLTIIAVSLLLSAAAASADEYRLVFRGERRGGPVGSIEVGGMAYLSLADLAQAFGASRHWNPRTQKAALAIDTRRIVMTDGSAFVSLGEETVNVTRPVLVRDGEVWVPRPFLTRALGPGTNSGVEFDAERSVIVVTRLGARITSVTVEQRIGGTAVVFALSDAAAFTAENDRRGSIDLVFDGAALADTLMVPEGVGHIPEISVRQIEGGVEATVSVSDAVRTYSAVYRRRPPRVEVVAEALGGSGAISPPLLEPRSLLPDPDDIFGGGGGIQTVMIDPGGGGHEIGSVGRAGLTSKEANLALAREIGEYLQDEGYYVFMTRHGDTHLTLKRRAEIANLAGASVFVSVQCGAHMSGAVGGFRVLYYEARPGVVRSGRGTERGGLVRRHRGREPAPTDALLWERVQIEYARESRGLARAVHERMDAAVDRPDRGVSRANLLVLGGCAMPAIQVEAGFITNRTDESLLSDHDYLRAVARSIARGVMDFTRGTD